MEKILIITYYWPPSAGSGVQRWLKFSKYLPEFGFKPIIYTPENPHFSITDSGLEKEIHPDVSVIKKRIWEPYKLAELFGKKKGGNQGLVNNSKKASLSFRILSYIRGNYFIPDPRKFWVKPSVKYLEKYIETEKIKFLVTTGPPHSMHLIGLKLKQKFPDLKWVVDIRDPWSRFDFLKQYGSSKKALAKQSVLEAKVLDACDIVLSTSYSMKNLLVPFDHSKFHTITNGYDDNDFRNMTSNSSSNKITIYHAGLMNNLRNPKNLWRVLNDLCVNNPDINDHLVIHLVGTIDPEVVQSIESFDHLKSKLIIEGYKKHSDLISDYAQADILLLLVNNSDNAAANIPGKLFEYMAVGKPILTISPEQTDAVKLLSDYKKSISFDYEEVVDLDSIKAFIIKSKDEYNGETGYEKQYERRALTSQLTELINREL